jgi:hypothetical protein
MNGAVSIRDGIVDFLRRELIGADPRPEQAHLNGGEEILRPQDPPRLRYSAGVLFPTRASVEQAESATQEETDMAESGPAEGDEPEDLTPGGRGGETDTTDEYEVNRANEFLPSAIGLTALVRLPKQLRVKIRGARYEKIVQEDVGRQDKEGKWQPHWWRRPIEDSQLIDCAQFSNGGPRVGKPRVWIETGDPKLKLELHVLSRPYAHARDKERDRIVTFTLINRTPDDTDLPFDAKCVFQCELMIENADDGSCFFDYPERQGLEEDEEASLRLLYRHRRTFAIGHGCAAAWPECDLDGVGQIWTETLPRYEIKPILPREFAGLELSMRRFADAAQNPAISEDCARLAEAYDKWIEEKATEIANVDFPAEHRAAAERHVELCRTCHGRIMDGIELLGTDADARQAFAWMNQVMLEQQLHYDLTANHRREWETANGELRIKAPYVAPNWDQPPPGRGRWRPFQLAFILMNIRAIIQRESDDRSIVDLIWFPTGGGKTEAYLGLTAFAIFWRRLEDAENAGTTVLMRYTLRLLTTQQFQRAASLICACELIRRQNTGRLGDDRISIGLWVGQSVTPNGHGDAVAALNSLMAHGKDNPFLILACPWCGAAMGPVNFERVYKTPGYKRIKGRVIFRCEDPACDFRHEDGLPLHVVDEAIYEQRPTLLIGTVDKFAMLPWNADGRRLFGLQSDDRLSPPDLIIQDELHLISGALGSMVGIYEGTIDALCWHRKGTKHISAKIIASTATICRAPEQVHALYARDVFLFPPQGLRAGDSFFAHEASDVAGRLYVGVFGSALGSHVTAQVRVMSALLQAVKCVPGAANLLDPYWTLMAYFNSLRELGHAATLIRADIREYLNAMWDRMSIRRPQEGSGAPDLRRFINRDLELTSRIQSNQITEVLQDLFNRYTDARDKDGRPLHKAVDVCIATNMIQVGLDVPRLGLMTVVGQPKMTSEYIQATSRVGRSEHGPGLVVTVYNPAKPRDRSHFEHFRSYHQSIYRWVEPTSVTPFAVPVRERALHAQIITLARYWGSESLRERPQPPPSGDLLERLRKAVFARVRAVDSEEASAAEEMFEEIVERWARVQPAIYGHFGPPPEETPLMYPSGTQPRPLWGNRSKATPSSMRNVDAGCDAEVLMQFPQP